MCLAAAAVSSYGSTAGSLPPWPRRAAGCAREAARPCRSLAVRGAAGEEVGGHLALSLHLDQAAKIQLVAVADQHVAQVCGHLRGRRGRGGEGRVWGCE